MSERHVTDDDDLYVGARMAEVTQTAIEIIKGQIARENYIDISSMVRRAFAIAEEVMEVQDVVAKDFFDRQAQRLSDTPSAIYAARVQKEDAK